jgi:hypothetical protein
MRFLIPIQIFRDAFLPIYATKISKSCDAYQNMPQNNIFVARQQAYEMRHRI